jgi:hypothetical protein
MMMRATAAGRDGATSIRAATDEIFGRWPAWPWSVLILIAGGGIVGAASAPALRAAGVASSATLGTFACAGYGLVAAAFLSLLPRIGRLLLLQQGVARRPETIDEAWWPLRLLPAALASTPTLRRTHEEFSSAVAAAAGQVRGILAHRLWPAWAVAFVAPVLGLMTAWQNGATVQVRFQPDAGPGAVLPALISQVSPPMVATIAASLALMVVAVAIDQWTKGLLQRWLGIVEAADGGHPAVAAKLSLGPVADAPRPGRDSEPPSREPSLPPPSSAGENLPVHPLDPEELARLWQQSQSRERS